MAAPDTVEIEIGFTLETLCEFKWTHFHFALAPLWLDTF